MQQRLKDAVAALEARRASQAYWPTLDFVATAPGIVTVTDGGQTSVEYTITAATCS